MKYNGNEGVFKAVTSGGAVAVVGEVKNFTLTETANTIPANAMGDEWTDNLAGKKSFTGNLEVHWDPSDAAQEDLRAGQIIDFEVYPTGEAAGKKFTGTAIVNSRGISNTADDDTVGCTVDITGKGALTEAAVA